MVCTSSDSSGTSSSSSSSESECEFEGKIDERANGEASCSIEKGSKKVGEEGPAIKKTNNKTGKKSQDQGKKKQERKKEEKSITVLRKAIAKHKEAQQKVNKKLGLALKQVRLERRKQISKLNKFEKKAKPN